MLVKPSTLAEHHRRCEVLFVAAREAAGEGSAELVTASVSALREALLSHFRYEEQHIFPLYEQASGIEGATEWLCAQHDDMRGMLWLLGSVSPETDRQYYQTELAALQAAFDTHAAEEESRMYPAIEPLLGR